MAQVPLFGWRPGGCRRWLAIAVATATACLVGAGGAQATVTTSNVTPPSDGTLLLWNGVSDPSQTFTVSGTTNGTSTTNDAVDIDCYDGGSVVMSGGNPVRYQGSGSSGIAVNADGSFTASVPLANFAQYGCELLAVPHGTTPSPPTGFTGPRVGVSYFDTVGSGPSAGDVTDFNFTDVTTTATDEVNASGDCGPEASLYDGSPEMNAGPYLLYCTDSLYGYSGQFSSATSPDLTRSEIEVDGQNAYDALTASELTASSASNSGFPPLTVTLDGFNSSTGAAQTTDTEALVECDPNNVFDPASSDCSSFVSSGVTLTRVTDFGGDGRIATVTDTYTSTDGNAHALDVDYETDLANATAGWVLPGQSSFTQHSTGQMYGPPASAPGTIYTVYDTGAAASYTNPVAAMTFSSPYTSITFDNTLWSGYSPVEVSALIDYQRTVPAGGSVTISWSDATGASLAETLGDAASAADVYAPPAIVIFSPASGATVSGSPVTVAGTATAGSGVRTVTVNGVAATVNGATFAASVPLTAGANTISATVTSNAGGASSASETVTDNGSGPTASTGSASHIGSSTARLSGKVTPDGTSASYYFQYGKTSRYGHQTRVRSLAAGTRGRSVSAQLSRLAAHTTYHYRLVATGKGGTSDGSERKFQTRFALKRLRVKVSPHHAAIAPYRFTVSGSLTLPKGVSRAQGCKGTVTVLAKHGAKKVSSHRARVTKKCRYSGRETFSAKHLKGHGKLSFTVTFNGNRKLGARTAKAVRALFG